MICKKYRYLALTILVVGLLFFAISKANAQSSGLQYTIDDWGLQTLTYNGQSYITDPVNSGSSIVTGALFEAPDGTQKPYGWLANSLDSNLSIGASVHTFGTNPDFNNQIYRQGKSDSFTVNWSYSATDSRTLKVDVAVTNNDSTDTLKEIGLEYFMWLAVPRPLTKEIPYLGSNLAMGSGPRDTPTAFLQGDWGSVIVYTDDYSNHWEFNSATNNYDAGASNVKFLIALRNSTAADGDAAANTVRDTIGPGQTFHYRFYIRFGSASDTTSGLAPEAYSAFRNTVPYLVNWPDRRPIARWFIGKGADYGSATNPRSYLWDPAINVFDQADFTSRVLAATDNTIAVMNGMNPKPQGIIIWDLEGDEFYHYFTYVGYPNKLHDLAPEMDAVADQMFQKFKDAGYKVGITLRPGDFQTGPKSAMPSTCVSSATNVDLDDIYIATDGTYPNRGYTCTSPNTWNNSNAHHPYHQHSPQDDATLFRNLESKVAYARNRWGAKLFYVDSTVYSGNGGGNSFNYTIFRRLQQEFPDVLFMPENESMDYWSASAPYNQTNPAVGGGVNDTPQEVRNIYPGAFSVLANYDGVNFNDPATHAAFLASVQHGNIFMVDGWFANPADLSILSIYRESGITTPGGGSGGNPPPNPTTYTLTVSKNGTGSGTVTGGSVNCGSTCSQTSNSGTVVTLTASPAGGSTFTSWNVSPSSNGTCSTATTCTITLNSNTTVTASFTASVVLTPDVTAPTVSITAPTNNSSVSGTVNISATAADPQSPSGQTTSGMAGVQFKLDGANLGGEVTSPYSGSWNTIGVTNGSHILTAVARDTAGNLTTSSGVNVTVNNAPVVALDPDTTVPTTPAGLMATAVSPYQINLSWTPSTDPAGPSSQVAPSGVAGYKIYLNGSSHTSVSGNYYSHSGLNPGTKYTYALVAYDSAGNVSSQSVSVSATTLVASAGAPTPLLISKGGPWSIFPPGTKSAILVADTNRQAICEYSPNSSTTYGSGTKFASTNALHHQSTINNLKDNSLNTFYIRCRDSDGELSAGSYVISFSVAKPVVVANTTKVVNVALPTGTFQPASKTSSVQPKKPVVPTFVKKSAPSGVPLYPLPKNLSSLDFAFNLFGLARHGILPVIGL